MPREPCKSVMKSGKRKPASRRARPISVELEVSYVPYPDDDRRLKQLAYDTHARLFLKAKERMLKGGVERKSLWMA